MTKLNGKKILLGVTGGIAAYKAAELVRLLKKGGAEVQVVMTRAAQEFITPMTLQALSGREVRQALFDPVHEAAMGHIELARWADLILIAPASGHSLARLALGMADDLLTTLCLAATAPIAVAPAMNRQMWLNPATRENVRRLEKNGISIWGPAEGEQACGDTGPGRMLEPEELYGRIEAHFSDGPLKGVRVLLTAGPTREPIDPVRFVGNRSSGKMGFALARAFAAAGAEVTLVSGPVALDTPAGVVREDVETAQQMLQAVQDCVAECDIFVACAAVADYRPQESAEQKIKKGKEQMEVHMVRNPDILAEVAALAKAPFTVGFAAETERLQEHAEEKRRAKGVDMIAANLVGAEEGGFERDENALSVFWEEGSRELALAGKEQLANELVSLITENYYEKN
jgi:phosphopantothenoylcysteine decarboxylase/phosphopantothenate--cysteine ligase